MKSRLHEYARRVQGRNDIWAWAYWSLRSSLAERTPVLITFDGTDWRHRWRNGCLFLGGPVATPITMSTTTLKLFFAMSRPQFGGVAVDVGAGSGTEIHILSHLVGPEGLVVAVEVDEDACRHIEKLCGELGLRNVSVHQVAVGQEAGQSMLVSDSTASQVAHLACADDSPHMSLGHRVSVVTLDSLLMQWPGAGPIWIKMNIEGAEAKALAGAPSTLSRGAQLVISCHDFLGPKFATHDTVVETLEAAGYYCENSVPEPSKPWTAGYVYAFPPKR